MKRSLIRNVGLSLALCASLTFGVGAAVADTATATAAEPAAVEASAAAPIEFGDYLEGYGQ